MILEQIFKLARSSRFDWETLAVCRPLSLPLSHTHRCKTQNGARGNSPERVAEFVVAIVVVVTGLGADLRSLSLSLYLSPVNFRFEGRSD